MATQWFVEPEDDFTNEVVADMLEASQSQPEKTECNDTDGKPLKLWECTYPQVGRLQKSRFPIRFKVYKRAKNYGPVELAPGFAQQHKPKKKVDLHLVHFDNPPTRPAH